MNLERRPGISQEGKFQERVPYAGNLRVLSDISVFGKSIIFRADLDVSPEEAEDSLRIKTLKNTTDYLSDGGAKRVILIGHRGRPQGQEESLSTNLLVPSLKKALNRNVEFIGSDINRVNNGTDEFVLLFENLRFCRAETDSKSDPYAVNKFSLAIASMGEVYVNNAIATSHRDNASMVVIPTLVPEAVCGLQVEKEVNEIEKALSRPRKDFVVLVGGAKIETKLPVIYKLSQIAEMVLVGGKLPAETKNQGLTFRSNVKVAELAESGRDISEKSAEEFAGYLRSAKTIVWNGSMGVFEKPETAKGTLTVAQAIAEATSEGNAHSVAGGGETELFLLQNNLISRLSHVSVAGGAMLEYLSGNIMPGLEVLRK